LVKHFGANSSRFTPSGREDVDVRMLGTGRPFVVQLLNARRTSCLNYKNSTEKLVRFFKIIFKKWGNLGVGLKIIFWFC